MDRIECESIETRLTALERRATGYRNALVALVLTLAGWLRRRPGTPDR